jgi:hypothetical protein
LSIFLRSRHTSWSDRRESFNMSDLECIHIDSCPDIDLGPLHVQLGLISCNRRMVVGIWVEQVRQAVVLLAHSFIGSPDYPHHAPMREINVRQKRCRRRCLVGVAHAKTLLAYALAQPRSQASSKHHQDCQPLLYSR